MTTPEDHVSPVRFWVFCSSRVPIYPDAMVVLNSQGRTPFLLSRIFLIVLTATGCGSSSAVLSGGTMPPRCADGRPQSEIEAAGLLPLEPHSQRIACVQVAEGTDRSYRLTDGRSLHLYEHVGPLPAKPTRSPSESGAVAIGAGSWSWTNLNGSLVLSADTPEGIYVELGLPTSASRSADIDLLKEIAATLRTPAR